MAVAPLRRGLPIDTPRERPPSPRQVARWITTTPSHRGLHVTEALGRLLTHCPELDRTHDLVRQFAAMLDTRDTSALPNWLEQLATSRLPAMVSLVKALREDQHAVVQGIATRYNSGVNEGPHHGPEAPEEDHGRPCRSSTPPPAGHPHGPPSTPLPVTECHRRTGAHSGVTKILPGPRTCTTSYGWNCTILDAVTRCRP
jgi:hypothetical protein